VVAEMKIPWIVRALGRRRIALGEPLEAMCDEMGRGRGYFLTSAIKYIR